MKSKQFSKDYTLAKAVATVLDDNKAENIQLIDISSSSIADYILIATANSTVHNKALIDKIEERAEEIGHPIIRRDGIADGRWVVLDYGTLLIHIFTPELRDFYHLEKIWNDGKNALDIAGILALPEFVEAEEDSKEA